jgi:adenosylmethionine-8-amino-7-oxononanoate aminotransferase
MVETEELINLDLKHLWHPCSQMKDYETFRPLVVERAYGCYFALADGRKVIDAISSWWCKTLGHNHPRLKAALFTQANRFEHVLLANTTNDVIVQLSQRLANLMPTLNKVTYASDGACAVEIAIKMSLHARHIAGDHRRNRFIALKSSYHGETIGALSVSDVGLYREPYKPLLFDSHFISQIPYVLTTNDPLWQDCSDIWPQIEASLTPYIETTTAIVVEPIVQGSAGMLIYSQDFLRRLREWSSKHGIHLIADEIMTGLGRTGKMLACKHAGIIPDFVCLGKGLTSGWLPLSAVITHNEVYNHFYDDYEAGKSFMHSHTFAGNALAASIALEVLKIFEEEKIVEHASVLGNMMHSAMQDIAQVTDKLTNVRSIGAIVAADLICETPGRRLGYEVYQRAVKLGALIRPLGNTIYWLPPLNMDMGTLEQLKEITQLAIMQS